MSQPTNNNGRVINLDSSAQREFERTPYQVDKNFAHSAIKGIHQETALNALFFSKENIDALQEGIRYTIYMRSCKKHVIGRQSDDELKIIMRSIYLQNAEHKPYALIEQVRQLNSLVLDYCVPRILNEIEGYMNYKKDISQVPIPMERSQNVNVKGTKVLELNKL